MPGGGCIGLGGRGTHGAHPRRRRLGRLQLRDHGAGLVRQLAVLLGGIAPGSLQLSLQLAHPPLQGPLRRRRLPELLLLPPCGLAGKKGNGRNGGSSSGQRVCRHCTACASQRQTVREALNPHPLAPFPLPPAG